MVPTFDVSNASRSKLAATHGSAVGVAPAHCRRRIDLRSPYSVDVPNLASTPMLPPADLQSAFCSKSSHEVILDSSQSVFTLQAILR